MVILGSGGVIELVNAQTENLFGYRRDELVGQPIELLIPERYRTKHPSHREGFFSSPTTRPMGGGLDLYGQRKDGSEFPCEIALSPLDTGGVTLVTAAVRDIAERKKAEAALRKSEERLVLSDRLSSLGTLAAGVAHEINNPLAYVMLNLELIAEEIRDLGGGSPSGRMKELEEVVSEARQGVERVRKIVRGLSTFSRADAEKRVVLDLHAVLDLSINMAFHEIKNRARLVRDYGVVPPVEADEARLGQLFVNLLVNAAHAIREGQVDRNEIRVITRTDRAGRATIEVRDTGEGMRPETLERIFDPFFTTKAVGMGTSLGLSICHGIVTALGGEIAVESTVGTGSTFRVTLPAAQGRPSKTLPPTRTASSGRRGRILVVDDEETLRTSLQRVLGGEHDVIVVANGREALALIATQDFDVILCDLMMPDLTGMDVHAELSRTAPAVADRMIFLTGAVFTPHAREFLDCVPNPRFEKPFEIQNLRAIIRERLR
ncbi:MAG: ATP-binding protein [Polyangiaceae bacterium]